MAKKIVMRRKDFQITTIPLADGDKTLIRHLSTGLESRARTEPEAWPEMMAKLSAYYGKSVTRAND